MYKNTDKIPTRCRDKLIEGKDVVYKARNLIKLYTKIDIGKVESFRYDFNFDSNFEFLDKYELIGKLYGRIEKIEYGGMDFGFYSKNN